MTRRWIGRTAPCIALHLLACAGGTETGNPSFEAKLSYQAYSSVPTAIGIREPGTELTVSDVWLTLGDVQFGVCGESASGSLRAPGIGVGDHANPAPVITSFILDAGTYCEVDMPFNRAPATLPAEAPAALVGQSVMIAGTLANGIPFAIASSQSTSLKLGPGSEGFAMLPSDPSALLGFDLAVWLSGLDLSSAQSSDGTVTISADRNAALLDEFERRLASGVALFRDADGDGRIDPGAVPLARAR